MCIKDIENAQVRIKETFELKASMEKIMVDMIAKYEDETGVKIDRVFFRRQDTVPISHGIYTDLTLNVQ